MLGLDLCWAAGDLRFRDPAGGEFLLTPHEQRVGRLEAESRAAAESGRADREASARLEAEAEVRRLRELLGESAGTE